MHREIGSCASCSLLAGQQLGQPVQKQGLASAVSRSWEEVQWGSCGGGNVGGLGSRGWVEASEANVEGRVSTEVVRVVSVCESVCGWVGVAPS